MKNLPGKKLLLVFGGLVLLAGGFGGGWLAKEKLTKPKQLSPASPQLAFLNEVYQTIQTNYWEKISDEQLGELFLAGAEKLTSSPQPRKNLNKENLFKNLAQILKQIPGEKQNDFAAQLSDLVLANLAPAGRSRLYTKKEEKSLAEAVHNVTTEDFYQVLEVPKDASEGAIAQAFQEKQKSATAAAQLQKLKKAYQTLSDSANRQLYDQAGIEPTIEYQLLTPDILHLHLKKISPTSLDELTRVAAKFDGEGGPTTLIFDLRDNVGGSLDILPYFLGPFIGPDSEAFRLYHQGEKQVFRTQTGWLPSLVRYKKVVILINSDTQSSAEAMAAALKKYNVGVVVGTPTKGWGTVERVFPLSQQLDQSNKYSIFLVHSLVLRDDGQPIEGKGVEPVVDIRQKGWEKELGAYFNYPELVQAVKNLTSENQK
ncbi:MAG: S41 family peptidase [Microgenomates group bacterium]